MTDETNSQNPHTSDDEWAAKLHDVPSESVQPPAVNDEPEIIGGFPFPRVWSRDVYRKMTVEQKEAWRAERNACMEDGLKLSQILGLDLQENPHRRMFDLFVPKKLGVKYADLDPVHKKRQFLWPRGLGKSSAVRVDMVQTILNYPNARLCFLTGGDDLAVRTLKAVRKLMIESPTPTFLRLFPEFCRVSKRNQHKEWEDVLPDLGNNHEFNTPRRTNTTLIEPTFCISSPRAVQTGSHYEFIYIDDLVHDRNWTSPQLLAKCYQDYLALCPRLDPYGYIVMSGTRYAVGDTYDLIAAKMAEMGESSTWLIDVQDCWSTDCLNCGCPKVFHNWHENIVEPKCTRKHCEKDGCASCPGFVSDPATPAARKVLFPVVLNGEGNPFGHDLTILQGYKLEYGDSFFSAQYENSVAGVGQVTFTPAVMDPCILHHDSQLNLNLGETFAVGDFAFSTKPDRDDSVMFAFKKYQGRLTVYKCDYGKWSASERTMHVLRFIQETRCKMMFIEKTLGAEDFELQLQSRAHEIQLAKLPVQFLAVSNTKDAKNIRIGGIEGAMSSHRLFLYSQMKGFELLMHQLEKWPHIHHDDFADALAQVLTAPTFWQTERPPREPNVLDWLGKYLPRPEPLEERTENGNDGTGFCY